MSSTQRSWLNQHPNVYSAINIYIDAAQLSFQDGADYVNFSVAYLIAHPFMQLATFENEFMTVPEGMDGPDNFDQSFWDDPNLVFQTQSLPSFQDFSAAYPNVAAEDVYNLIGGEILANHIADHDNYKNACALRVSRALNYSGVTIPSYTNPVTGKHVTQTGNDGKNYFLSAKELNAWMKKTFGAPTYHFTKAQGGPNGTNFPGLLANIKGIYSMISSSAHWGSGHADLINNADCDIGCHFDAPVSYIDVWVLQ